MLQFGADSMIFNGYTTVNADSKFVVLDTFSLQNSDERIKKAQYYNILTHNCYHFIIESNLLIASEASVNILSIIAAGSPGANLANSHCATISR